MPQVQIAIETQQHVGFDADVLSSLAQSVLLGEASFLLGYGPIQATIVFVTDDEIQALNRDHRQKDETTDVLSFPMMEQAKEYPQGGELGDIFISVDTLRKQAAQHGHNDMAEAKILVVHGLLHLLGHDHETPSEFEAMLALERKYLGDNAGLIERSRPE